MKMNWKILNDIISMGAGTFIGIAGYGSARDGETNLAIWMVLFLVMYWSSIRDQRKIEKLENTVLSQESVILRTEYIRNRMLEDGLWK